MLAIVVIQLMGITKMKVELSLTLDSIRAICNMGNGSHGEGIKILANWLLNVEESARLTANHFGLDGEAGAKWYRDGYFEYAAIEDTAIKSVYSVLKVHMHVFDNVDIEKSLAQRKAYCEFIAAMGHDLDEVLTFRPKHADKRQTREAKRPDQLLHSTLITLDEETRLTAVEIGDGAASKGLRIALEWAKDKDGLMTTFEGRKTQRCVSLNDTTVEIAKHIGSTNKSMGVRRAVYAYHQYHKECL